MDRRATIFILAEIGFEMEDELRAWCCCSQNRVPTPHTCETILPMRVHWSRERETRIPQDHAQLPKHQYGTYMCT